MIKGKGVLPAQIKNMESGSLTESREFQRQRPQGRVHTSAITVAVIPEVEDVEVDIKPNDIKMDVLSLEWIVAGRV